MSEERFPGVFIEETSFRVSTIPGVAAAAWALALVLIAFALVRLRRHRGASAA